jgi:hypothetical protein
MPLEATLVRELLAGSFMKWVSMAEQPRNAKCPLEGCKARRHWTLVQWKQVLWSDESHFTIWQSKRTNLVLAMPGECYLPKCIVTTVTFGGEIMI